MATVINKLLEAQELVDELEREGEKLIGSNTYWMDQAAMIRQALEEVQRSLGYNR